ncbi:acetate kinase [Ruminococcus sp. CAG:382]|nr:acetate kinase [Ruminococcus sp. CAG:382]
MYILVVNAGSSSLKYQLYDMDTNKPVAKGVVEAIGETNSKVKHERLTDHKKFEDQRVVANHTDATKITLDLLTSDEYGSFRDMSEIYAVGHRIVHGGPWLTESVLVTDSVIADLEKCVDIAPLHTLAHLAGIRGCMEVMKDIPQVLVIDTAFHRTMPAKAYMYPLPYSIYEKYKIRRYGFHGTSHRYVSGKVIDYLGGNPEGTKIITCHIGNGSSITAIKDGRVVDTSMGFTPLDGIEMGSRCGAIDPAIVPFIMEKENISPKEMQNYMNKECGLLGVSGVSGDMRLLMAAVRKGEPRAVLAYDILIYDIQKYIGGYVAALNGVDAIAFTAGIGENTPELRRDVINGLSYLGVKLDEEKNLIGKNLPEPALISTPDSKVKVYVVETDEELVIASDTRRVVEESRK